MERRSFVKGAFGLAVLAVGVGVFGSQGGLRIPSKGGEGVLFTTSGAVSLKDAVGPAMQPGIELSQRADTVFTGSYDGLDLFDVDATGAELIALADGSRTIDELAVAASEKLGATVSAADAAAFFVDLGEAGYLANTVLVNLVENAG